MTPLTPQQLDDLEHLTCWRCCIRRYGWHLHHYGKVGLPA